MPKVQELVRNKGLFASGHRACSGCGPAIVMNQVLMAAGPDTIGVICTGCIEVVSTIFPYTAWNIPFIHVAFENSAAVASGIESAYKALSRKGKLKKRMNIIAFGGDGGTYDIGLQALSGALERGHKFLYVCYDNEAYMNTGIQRSSATPTCAHTTTSPAGRVIPGKTQPRKDLTEIVVAHDIPYAAQAAPHNWMDLTRKVEKALAADGPSFINVLSPCPVGWRYPPHLTIQISKLATDTCFWPLYEVDNGHYRISYKPREKLPVTEWLKLQGRFNHLFRGDNKEMLDRIQEEVDRKWELLLRKVECFK